MRQYFILILVILLVGCQNIVCEKPYMRFEKSCCLDKDYNDICDNDEIKKENLGGQKENPTETIVIKEKPEQAVIEEEQEKSFDVEITYMKQKIRLLDQALVFVNIMNHKDYLETYLIRIDDDRWIIRSEPNLELMRIGVRSEGKNYLKLIIQPNRNLITEKGNYLIDIEVRSEKVTETIVAQADIIIS